MNDDSESLAHVRTTAELVAMHEAYEFSIKALALVLDGCGEFRGQLAMALETSAREFRGARLALAVTQGLDPSLAGVANTAYRDTVARSMERLTEALHGTAS